MSSPDFYDAHSPSSNQMNVEFPPEMNNGIMKEQSEYNGENEAGQFDADADVDAASPMRSIEGWIALITNIHEEATDADLLDRLADFGPVTNLQMPLDRRTGYVKGYALAEYKEEEQVKQLIKSLNGAIFMDKELGVDWAILDRPRVP